MNDILGNIRSASCTSKIFFLKVFTHSHVLKNAFLICSAFLNADSSYSRLTFVWTVLLQRKIKMSPRTTSARALQLIKAVSKILDVLIKWTLRQALQIVLRNNWISSVSFRRTSNISSFFSTLQKFFYSGCMKLLKLNLFVVIRSQMNLFNCVFYADSIINAKTLTLVELSNWFWFYD